MPKRYSFLEIQRVLLLRGFLEVSQAGSHLKFRKIGKPTLTVILPKKKKEMPAGTFHSILRQAALTLKEFEKLLK